MSKQLSHRQKSAQTLTQKEGRDFWLQYATPAGRQTWVPTLHALYHALYYLPENFKLLVHTQDPYYEMSLTEHRDLARRVQFDPQADTQTDEAFRPSILVYDESVEGRPTDKPLVIVRSETEQDLSREQWDRFIVSTNRPEALASAAMRIIRSGANI